MSDLLECFYASYAIPGGVINEEYWIFSTCEEGTEDGPSGLLFIYMGEFTIGQIYFQRIIFFQFIGHVGN